MSGLLALIDDLTALADDLATLADDVATLTVNATQKTSGIVTDDMAVTAEQALGLARERELPVVFAVARGSLFNKAVILVPAALVLDTIAPWAIGPILLLGGLYLSFEAVEKLAEKLLHHDDAPDPALELARTDPAAFEAMRVSGAIRTDLILSAEIVFLTLGEVTGSPLATKVGVLYAVSLVVTFVVYGLVGGLVKLDDVGEALVRRGGGGAAAGRLVLKGTPWLLRAISWVGTVAMLVVGGHLLLEHIPPIEALAHELLHAAPHAVEGLLSVLLDALTGLVLGAAAVVVHGAVRGRGHAH